MTVLDEINAAKKAHVQAQKARVSLSDLEARIKSAPAPRGFAKAIKNTTRTPIIAEVKKASPSKGIIRADFDPVKIARTYAQTGAACISVLTDELYFQGADAYLEAVRMAVDIPLLRKDFMIDPYQIYESRALGADCILLIMASLSDSQAAEMHDLARVLGMDALVEVHDRGELERSLAFSPEIIGVNNRNLKDLSVNLDVSHDLAQFFPKNTIKIAESGINTAQDIKNLQKSGYNGFLIGESLMRQDDIAAALSALL